MSRRQSSPRCQDLWLIWVFILASVLGRDVIAADRRPNVLLIAIDDLRCHLGAYGVSNAKTPSIDGLAAQSTIFTNHYVQVPTCGASRCALISGCYPKNGAQCTNKAIARTHQSWGQSSLPAWFKQHGYQTYALGKITHYPGGRTGALWADGPEELPGAWSRCWIPKTPWGEPEQIMHAYANGKPRTTGHSPPWEMFDGDDKSYPDAWIADEAVRTLESLSKSDDPWFFAVGFFKPHLPFAAPKAWYDLHPPAEIPKLPADVKAKPHWKSGWHASGEFRGNYGHGSHDPADDDEYAQQLRRAYSACVSYCDAQVGLVLRILKERGLDDNTIVVLWGDHGFLLGEHAIWGKHCLYENALRSPLIIRAPGHVGRGTKSSATVESVDVFPTLTELCGLSVPPDLSGQSLAPYLRDAALPSKKPAIGFTSSGLRTIRTDRWRLIAPPAKEGTLEWVELFDYQVDANEVQNHQADHPDVVGDLVARLPKSLSSSSEKE